MNEKSLISIILPVYNCEKYLNKCLESLINQTYPNIEILCINDGSTDNSLEILQKYANLDNRVKVFSQKNSGPAKSRNVGLKHMTGEYLMFCDSDDWYEPNMCEIMLNAMLENDVDIACCESNVIVEDLLEIRKCSLIYNKNLCKASGVEKIKDFNLNLSVLLWNKILKIDLIKKYKIDFPTGLESDDACFLWKYFSVAKDFIFVKQKLYNYVIRKNSVMDNFHKDTSLKHLSDCVKILENFYEFLKLHKLEKKFKKYILNLFVKQCKYFWTLPNLNDKEQSLAILIDVVNTFDYKFGRNSFLHKLKNGKLTTVEMNDLLLTKCREELIFGKFELFLRRIYKGIKFIPKYIKVYL